jgi:hypothetical protein
MSTDWHTGEFPPQSLRRVRLQADYDGNIVLPAELVVELGIGPRDVALAFCEGDELRLETLDSALDKAHNYFHSRVTTGYASDQLIADRRVEALRELWE